ncbi:MAG: hypothetical protein ABMA64_03985 [Myxococcota bacterium]
MARQPLMVLAALALACRQDQPYEGAFQLPVAAAVLQPELGGPFLEPVAFVANGHGGQIVPLALKQGRFLTDDPTAAFLRTNPIPTGASRRLGSVAVVARSVSAVELWATDLAFSALVRVPYLLDCEATPDRSECAARVAGAPVEQGVYWNLVERPEGGATISGISVKKGYTATEEWTVTFDGAEWDVVGSRSGRQARATTGEPYSSEAHRLSFTIEGDPQEGDRFVIRTENGLSEHGVGGVPLEVEVTPDQSLLAVLVEGPNDGRGRIRWFDPVARAVVGEVVLPVDASPVRLGWTEDGQLLAADRAHPAVWEIAPGDTVAIEHPTPWPTADVASLDGDDRRRLYVVPLDGSGLYLFDRDTDELLDVNGAVEGAQGIPFTAPVTGIEALRRPYWTPEYDDDAIRVTGRSVAVSLASSKVVFAHESTGCLVQDNLGPRTTLGQTSTYVGTSDFTTSYLTSWPYGAQLELEGASGRHVSVNTCGGLALSEQWTARFDQNVQAWRVSGSVSGDQVELAYEDQRYLSDEGQVSFLIGSRATPSKDGWEITFTVEDGVAAATGDTNGDGVTDLSLGVAADPVYFEYRAGLAGPIGSHEGSGWYPVDVRPFVLLPGASTDTVGRIDPQEAQVEVGWD